MLYLIILILHNCGSLETENGIVFAILFENSMTRNIFFVLPEEILKWNKLQRNRIFVFFLNFILKNLKQRILSKIKYMCFPIKHRQSFARWHNNLLFFHKRPMGHQPRDRIQFFMLKRVL